MTDERAIRAAILHIKGEPWQSLLRQRQREHVIAGLEALLPGTPDLFAERKPNGGQQPTA